MLKCSITHLHQYYLHHLMLQSQLSPIYRFLTFIFSRTCCGLKSWLLIRICLRWYKHCYIHLHSVCFHRLTAGLEEAAALFHLLTYRFKTMRYVQIRLIRFQAFSGWDLSIHFNQIRGSSTHLKSNLLCMYSKSLRSWVCCSWSVGSKESCSLFRSCSCLILNLCRVQNQQVFNSLLSTWSTSCTWILLVLIDKQQDLEKSMSVCTMELKLCMQTNI